MWCLTLSLAALAQEPAAPRWNAQLLRPAMDSTASWWTVTTDTPSRFQPGGSVTVGLADTPLTWRSPSGDVVAVVGPTTQTDVAGWVGGDRWRVGADVPVLVTSSAVTGDEAGLGDVGLEAKGVVARAPKVLNAGLTARLDLPTSTLDAALGAGGVGWELAAILDHAAGPVHLHANVGYRGSPRAQVGDVTLNDAVALRGGASWSRAGGRSGLSLEVAATPSLAVPLSDPIGAPAEWTAGAWLPLGDALVVRVGGGTGLTAGAGAPDWRLLGGLSTRWGAR